MTRQLLSHDAALERLAVPAQRIAAVSSSEAWLVGGVVRDAILDRPLDDIDVAVSGDPQRVARALARSEGGTAFGLSDRHGGWRVVCGDQHIDVCTVQGASIADDLTGRDFTMNAMAVACHSPARIIDPLDGTRDLRQGVVRSGMPGVLDDDPLRLLRAARFAHVLEMSIEVQTRAWIIERAAMLRAASGERIFMELGALLDAPEQRRGMRLLDELGLLAIVLPELDACRGMEQSRFHHLDVFEHTLAVLDNSEDILNETEFHLGLASGLHMDDPDSRRIIQMAALLHDVGKPHTRNMHTQTGSVTFVGHDEVGARMVDDVCDRWATSNRVRDSVKLLVRTHLALGMLLHGSGDRRARWRFLRSVEPRAAEAIILSLADRLATAGIDDRRAWVRRHTLMARTLWIEHWREREVGIPKPLLSGDEIAELTNITPGPMLGHVVRMLAEAQGVAEVTTRDQAVACVEGAARSLREKL